MLRWLLEDSSRLDLLEGKVSQGEFVHGWGGYKCPDCGLEVRKHPAWKEVGTFHLLCDGTVIKT